MYKSVLNLKLEDSRQGRGTEEKTEIVKKNIFFSFYIILT